MEVVMGHGIRSESYDDYDAPQMISDINIIPLVDVMLVLLIVFMVAAPLSFSGISVNLPTANLSPSQADSIENMLVVTVAQDGSVYVDREKLSIDELKQRMQSSVQKNASIKLIVRADKDVTYERVVGVMSAGKGSGIKKISLITNVEDLAL